MKGAVACSAVRPAAARRTSPSDRLRGDSEWLRSWLRHRRSADRRSLALCTRLQGALKAYVPPNFLADASLLFSGHRLKEPLGDGQMCHHGSGAGHQLDRRPLNVQHRAFTERRQKLLSRRHVTLEERGSESLHVSYRESPRCRGNSRAWCRTFRLCTGFGSSAIRRYDAIPPGKPHSPRRRDIRPDIGCRYSGYSRP